MAENSKSGFSSNILAIAGLITAIGGLIAILHQTKVISFGPEKEKTVKEIVEQPVKRVNNNEIIPVNNDVSNLNNTYETQTDNYSYNLSGNWYDTVNSGRYSFAQDNFGQISFQEHSLIEGTWIITAEGAGVVNGNQINIPYYTVYDTTGNFTGTINNNNSVTGMAQDYSSGLRVQLQLTRQN